MNILIDPSPSSEFDDWAKTYDASVLIDQFPFHGYQDVLKQVILLAGVHPGMSVLDLGTGTGNLAMGFASLGCELWCTDFSVPMLEIARQKLLNAHFVQHDLRCDWPTELDRTFDRIVSAYVFHHFKLNEKVRILGILLSHLNPGGRVIIGDIAFPNLVSLEHVKAEVGIEWEEEFYWLADEVIPATENLGFRVEYNQVSTCAGVFQIS